LKRINHNQFCDVKKLYLRKSNTAILSVEINLQLKESSLLVEIIAQKEDSINSRLHFYIPKEKPAEMENQLMDSDIVGITNSFNGLDISHMGILVRKAGPIHLLHASSSAEKVVLSEETLEEYLLNSKSAMGIMVARPL
jgi:hypothetical protein